MILQEKKKTCTPCQENAVLHVGDAICHRIASHDKSLNCHGLVEQVRSKRLTLDQYVEELNRRAAPAEKEHIRELRKIYG